MEAGDNGVAGFDVATIDAWLPSVSGATGPFTWTRLEGGHSNFTYLIVDSEGREFVIRRPPQGELLPKAHDMWREYRIIDGLWPTPYLSPNQCRTKMSGRCVTPIFTSWAKSTAMRYTPVKKLLRYLMCQQGSGQGSHLSTHLRRCTRSLPKMSDSVTSAA